MEHKNKDIKVTKNFLMKNEFDFISKIITGSDFSWFYQKEQNAHAKDGFFFSHILYSFDHINSDNFNNIITPLSRRIGYESLRRCIINLITRSDVPRRSIFHRDFDDDRLTTGILYINNNNGYTEFETGEKIKCISNMYVEFPCKLKHRSISQTDVDARCVINLNYYK